MAPPESAVMVTPSSRMPAPSRRSDAVPFSNGSPYAMPLSTVIAPKPIGCSYSPVRWNSPVNCPENRIVVDLERVAKTVQVPPGHAEPGVDLLAVVTPRVTEREETFRADLGITGAHHAVGDGEVAVLDDDPCRAGAPERVPRAEVLAAERPLNARTAERPGHARRRIHRGRRTRPRRSAIRSR